MSVRDDVNSLLEHLAGILECGALALDDNLVAMLGLEEDMGAVFYGQEGNNAGAVIISVVAGRPDPEDAELLYDLMCANYMWNASGNGTLGIDAESGLLTVQRLVELPLSPQVFTELFAELVGAARHWRGRILSQNGQGGLSVEMQMTNLMRV